MAIFRRDSEPDATPATSSRERPVRPQGASGPQGRSRHTLIAPGTEMIGEITGTTDVAIEGDLQGEVRIDGTVRVGRGGRVRGALEARVVEIGGKVKGDVRGRERIVLDASAELFGDLSAPRVEIHEGAFFKGAVEMTGGGTPKTGAARTATGKAETESRGKPESPGLFAESMGDDGDSDGDETGDENGDESSDGDDGNRDDGPRGDSGGGER